MKTNLFLDTVNFLLFPIFIVGTAINSCCTPVLPVLDNLITTIIDDCKKLTLAQLQQLQIEIDQIITIKKEEKQDRRLESAILALAEKCDGAIKRDGKGFNGCDAKFGHWLAERITKKQPLLKKQAKFALLMIKKYQGQLERGGFELPEWETIESQYLDKYPVVTSEFQENKPEKRLEFGGERIGLFSSYDLAEIQKIKAIHPSKKPVYGENGFECWSFSLDAIEEVCRYGRDHDYWIAPELIEIEQALLWERQEKARIAQEQAELEAAQKAEELYSIIQRAKIGAPLPDGRTLFEHQQKAVEWLIAHRKDGIFNGGILADHMGLGKTLSALVAAKILKKYYDCPVFVVCPVTLKKNWLNEAKAIQCSIEVYSWAKMPQPLESQQYILIADEAHYAQNLKSKRTQRLIEIATNENCRAAWLLTGTPIKNGRPINLFPLLQAIAHPLAANRREYETRYCNAHLEPFGWDNTGAAHLDELARKTEDCILRRTKSDCLDLPAKQQILKQAELDIKESNAYNAEIAALVQDYRDRVKRGEVDPDAQALVTLGILRKVGSKHKVSSVIALAEELLEQGQQVVIFGEFKDSVNAVYSRFADIAELLTGDTPQDQRQEMCDRFQRGESKVFIGTIKAGGVGITLTAANNVILLDRPWTPGDAEQAEDRCHRIGQKNAVSAYWVQLGKIDTKIDELIINKQSRIEKVLKGKTKTLQGLDSPKELAKELLAIL